MKFETGNRPGVRWASALIALSLAACTTVLPRPALTPAPIPPEIQVTPASRLTATFLGTSSLLIDDGRQIILVDGFLSRPSPLQLLLGPVDSDEAHVAAVIGEARLRRLSTVLVAHAHHDHVMDVASIIERSNAIAWGSEGVVDVLDAEGVPRLRREVIADRGLVTAPAPFEIHAIFTPHSEPQLFEGDIPPDFTAPAPIWRYRGGANLSFVIRHPSAKILVVPSVDPDNADFAGAEADVVFLGIGGVGRHGPDALKRLWCATVIGTGARWVIPIHWDDFFQPLRAPLPAMPYGMDSVDEALQGLEAFARADRIGYARMDALEVIDLQAAARSARPTAAVPTDCRA